MLPYVSNGMTPVDEDMAVAPHHAVREIAPLRTRLREKLPEILIEAMSVVLALLLAFAANSWHQHEQQARAADRAKQAITSELESNREQLRATRASIRHAITRLQQAIASVKAGNMPKGNATAIISPFSPLLPTAAAWHTAQTTGVVTSMDYAWILQVAKVHELETAFMKAQSRVIFPATPVSVSGMEVPGSAGARMFDLLRLKHELVSMKVLSSFGNELESSYAALLDAPDRATRGNPDPGLQAH